jgi:hypothetical protein
MLVICLEADCAAICKRAEIHDRPSVSVTPRRCQPCPPKVQSPGEAFLPPFVIPYIALRINAGWRSPHERIWLVAPQKNSAAN